MAPAEQETQYQSAQRMYTARASDYEKSWHPEYTERFMALADIKPGDRVLDLACGTGLDAIIAARKVGNNGLVVGVDATAAMLERAEQKISAEPELNGRIELYQHDVTDLDGCAQVQRQSFDFILCSNAFVLFDDPARVVAHWRDYLKPGGRVVIDITHEHNLLQGLVMEIVAKKMGMSFPSNRSWIKSADSFRKVLEGQGFLTERVEVVEKELGKGSVFLDISDAETQFDYITSMPLVANINWQDVRPKALALYKKEWAARAINGKVEISDTLYVYVARKL